MIRRQINLINDFSGGCDTRTPLLTMPLTSSPNMRNFHTSGMKNRLIKRGGFSKINSSAVVSDNLDVFYPCGYQTKDYNLRDIAADTQLTQGFKPNTTGGIIKVRLWLKKVGAPTGNIILYIYTDNGGIPGSALTNGSVSVDVSTLATTYGWITFTFATAPSVTAGTKYHLLLTGDFTVSSTNYAVWGVDNYDIIYPNGQMTSYDGTTYNAQAYNACFEIYIKGGLLGTVNNALFDFSSKEMLLGVFGTSLYNMTKNVSGTPNGTWMPLSVSSTLWDSYTTLILHMDGINGSTTFTDSENVPKTVTANGNAKISTTTPKFGTGSGSFDGTNSYLSIPYSTDFVFGSNDFTIDFWINFSSTTGAQTLFLQDNLDSGATYFRIQFSGITNKISLNSYTSNVANVDFSASWTPTTLTWYHLAFVRRIGTWYIFINGVSQTLTLNAGAYVNSLQTLVVPTLIGGNQSWSAAWFAGNLDEFRISTGIARWTANFTVATAAYSPTSGTLTSSRFWTFSDWQSGTALINSDVGLYSFSGSGTITQVSAAPISKFIVIWKNYCLAFGLRGFPNGYQFSALNDYTTWPSANIFNNGFDTNDGDIITGVRILKGKLYVFKRYSIFRMTLIGTNPTFQIDLIIGTGSPCHYAIKEIDFGGTIGTVLIFPTTDKKLAIFDGYNIQIINENLTEKSNDLFSDSDTPISFSDMNYIYTDLFHAVAKTDTSEYILYAVLNTDTTVKYAFVFDWKTGGIYPYDNQVFSSSLYAFSTNKAKILYTGGQTGYMWQMENTNADDGSAINAYWVSGKIRPQSAGLLNKLLSILLYFEQISSGTTLNINVQYRFDWNVTWGSVQTVNYDRNDSFAFGITKQLDIGTIENMFQIKLQDNSTQLAATFYGVDLFGETMGVEVEDRAVS